MKIAVLGKGQIGSTIGDKWQAAGQEVVYGVRSPDRSREAVEASISRAVAQAGVILFAVPSQAVPDLAVRHAKDLNGKILIDATNDLRGTKMSRVVELAASAPDAKIYRAFNSLGWEVFKDPTFGDQRADMFYCGSPDQSATGIMDALIEAVGLRPVRIGGLEKVDVVDAIVHLYFAIAREAGFGRHSAFKLLTRSQDQSD